MLRDADVLATIAVRDLKQARKFYEEKLGLSPGEGNEDGVIAYRSGNAKLLVYESEFAGTNHATAATWIVPDAEPVVAAIRAKGVRFEHYELPGLTRQGDLHVAGSFKGAWVKDPDGNILHILSE